jgi:cytochrome c55X
VTPHRARPSLWILAVFAVLSVSRAVPAHEMESTTSLRAAALTRLVQHDCGSCHGMTLRGGLGPALTPSALTGRSADYISWVIAIGRGERAMPGWSGLLSRHEIDWIAAGLLEGRFLPQEPR